MVTLAYLVGFRVAGFWPRRVEGERLYVLRVSYQWYSGWAGCLPAGIAIEPVRVLSLLVEGVALSWSSFLSWCAE